jgi:hypothetical protein
MSGDPNQPRSKLIIDEDWKTQAQAEKQRLQEELERKQSQPGPDEGHLPPASFPMLVTTLATQALLFLGQMPHPVTGKAEVHLEEAKHFIDMLQMLQEKTQGNLTPEEGQMLEQILHELRMAFVAISGHAPGSASQAP